MRPKPTLGITWTNIELSGLLEDEDSHVHQERVTKHLALLPCHLSDVNAAIRQYFDENINIYDPELKGLVLAYKNPKVLTPMGTIMYDTYYIHIDIEADFYVFRPEVGQSLRGFVNKKGTNHVGLLVHKAFNVSVPKPDSLENWPDTEDDFEWPGHKLKVGQEVRFTLDVVDFKSRLPYVRGSLNEDYTRGCKLFNEEIAATFNNESYGSEMQNFTEYSHEDQKEVLIKLQRKRIVFSSDSENEVDQVDEEKERSKEEDVAKKISKKKRKRISTSPELESETEIHASKKSKIGIRKEKLFDSSNDSSFEVPETSSKKKKRKLKMNGSELLDESEVIDKEVPLKITDCGDLINTDDERSYKKALKKMKVTVENGQSEKANDFQFAVPKLKTKKKKKVSVEDPSLMDTEDEREYKLSLKPLVEGIKEETSRKKHKKLKKHKGDCSESETELKDRKVNQIGFDE